MPVRQCEETGTQAKVHITLLSYCSCGWQHATDEAVISRRAVVADAAIGDEVVVYYTVSETFIRHAAGE
jgi:hypothetical protein